MSDSESYTSERQLKLFEKPIQAVSRDPVDLGTSDVLGIYRCSDGCEYAVKDDSCHSAIPHSEWFCTNLAEAIGIPSPVAKVVEIEGGKLAFGSRWLGGALEGWPNKVRRGEIQFDGVKSMIGKIFVFDLFIHNVDRNAQNYIFEKQRSAHSVISFDYSNAWLTQGFPLPDLPLLSSHKTIVVRRWLKDNFGEFVSVKETEEVIEAISDVAPEKVASIIERHPVGWLSDGLKHDIMHWWTNGGAAKRLSDIRAGLGNGTYL